MDKGTPKQGSRLAVFAQRVNALATGLPCEGEFADVPEQLRTVAHDICAPSIVAVLGTFNAGKSTLINAVLGESVLKSDVLPANARVVMLRYANHAALTAYTTQGLKRTFRSSDLHKIAFEGDEQYAATRKDLAFLVLDLPNHRLRDLVLVDTPGLYATHADHAESTVNFLDRVDAIIWVTRVTGAARATEVDFLRLIGRPADLLVVNDLDSIDPDEIPDIEGEIARIQTRFGDWACKATGLSAANALKAIQAKDTKLLKESRLAELCEALGELSRSAKVREHKVLNAATRVKNVAVRLTKRFAELASELNLEVSASRARLMKGCAERTAIVGEIRRWERRRSWSADWLGRSEDSTQLTPELRQQLAAARKKFNDLGTEQRSHQSRITRDTEEKAYLDRRRIEVDASKRKYESKGFFDWLTDRLFGEEKEQLVRDIQELERRSQQRETERRELVKAAEDLSRRSREIEAEAGQLATSVVRHLNGRKQKIGNELRLVRAELRRIRWRLQAHCDVIASAVTVSSSCDALEEAALELVCDVSPDAVAKMDECMHSLHNCRDASNNLLLYRSFSGNPKLLSGYRRILSWQVQLVAGRIADYSGALAALEMGITWAPKSEVWREAALLAKSEDSSLARLAEGIAGWLCGADGAAQRTGRSLAIERPTVAAMDEVTEFLLQHGGELRDGFFTAILAGAPKLKRDVFRRAPRFSATYHRAIVMIGAELLTAVASAKGSGVNRNG